jgi:tRNA threonylcarbamoyladenosine biosynthesis protein TsaE
VTSPSFSIVHQHHARIGLTHADLYRLTGPTDLDGTGFHELRDGPGATLVEWVDRVPGAAPTDAMRIELLDTAETARELVVTTSGPRSEHLLQRWKDELIGLAG